LPSRTASKPGRTSGFAKQLLLAKLAWIARGQKNDTSRHSVTAAYAPPSASNSRLGVAVRLVRVQAARAIGAAMPSNPTRFPFICISIIVAQRHWRQGWRKNRDLA